MSNMKAVPILDDRYPQGGNAFVSLDKLLVDFWTAVDNWRP
jgi:hypothetical protein